MSGNAAFMCREYHCTPSTQPCMPTGLWWCTSNDSKSCFRIGEVFEIISGDHENMCTEWRPIGNRAGSATSAQPKRNNSEVRKRDDLKPEVTLLLAGIGTSFENAIWLPLIERTCAILLVYSQRYWVKRKQMPSKEDLPSLGPEQP